MELKHRGGAFQAPSQKNEDIGMADGIVAALSKRPAKKKCRCRLGGWNRGGAFQAPSQKNANIGMADGIRRHEPSQTKQM
jgi:hypothetical protein